MPEGRRAMEADTEVVSNAADAHEMIKSGMKTDKEETPIATTASTSTSGPLPPKEDNVEPRFKGKRGMQEMEETVQTMS